jgi:hypothetical protein
LASSCLCMSYFSSACLLDSSIALLLPHSPSLLTITMDQAQRPPCARCSIHRVCLLLFLSFLGALCLNSHSLRVPTRCQHRCLGLRLPTVYLDFTTATARITRRLFSRCLRLSFSSRPRHAILPLTRKLHFRTITLFERVTCDYSIDAHIFERAERVT